MSAETERKREFSICGIFLIIRSSEPGSGEKRAVLDKKKSEDLAQRWYDKLKFKAEGIHSPIMSLSGGKPAESADRQRNRVRC